MTIRNDIIELADASVDRDAWREARRHVITATQAAVIAGGHPYSSLIDVWNDKTDPNWIEEPNRYLDERASLGNTREAAIIEWASEELEVKLTPNGKLLTSMATRGHACTPDAWAWRPYNGAAPMSPRLIIVDAKTTQQDWLAKGAPQHVIDQMLWTFDVTRADHIYLAVEQYKWAKGVPTFVTRYIIEVERDDVRLAFIRERVAEFEKLLAEGIAPESDVDMRELLAADVDDWLTPDEAEARAEFVRMDDVLTELDELRERLAPMLAREAELTNAAKAIVKAYAGRRVWMIGARLTAKLVRSYRVNVDQSKLDRKAVAAARSWAEVETVKFEKTPTEGA